MTKQFLILLIMFFGTTIFGQTKTDEAGKYVYQSNSEVVMHSVKINLKLNAKTNYFSAITYFKGDLSKHEEKLEGKYVLHGDTIVFSFTYSQFIINPMFTCRDPEGKSSVCSDTLIYKTNTIYTKDKEIVLKKIK